MSDTGIVQRDAAQLAGDVAHLRQPALRHLPGQPRTSSAPRRTPTASAPGQLWTSSPPPTARWPSVVHPARNGRSATYFDEVWEDADHVLVVTYQAERVGDRAARRRRLDGVRRAAAARDDGRPGAVPAPDPLDRGDRRDLTRSRPREITDARNGPGLFHWMVMHRQIAGTLTGRVTKWIVLVAVLALTGIMADASRPSSPTSRTTRPPRGCPSRRSRPRSLEELSETVDPNDIPTLVVYQRDGGLTEDDLAAIEADGAGDRRDRRGDRRGRADARGRGGSRGPGRTGADAGRPRTARSPTSTSCSTSAPTAGTTIPDTADEIRDIAAARRRRGPPRRLRRPGRRLRRGVRGHRHQPDRRHARRRHRDPALHLPQPDPVAAADLLCGRRPTSSRRAWSTSWRSTPTSPSTGRARPS